MIPIPSALDIGNYRLRAQRVVGTGQWVMLTREPARAGAKVLVESPSVDALVATVPSDAWRGTAGELAAIIAPVGGEHCTRCGDTLVAPCACCGGEGQIACSACDGEGEDACACEIAAKARIARIRGGAWGGRMLAVLRGLLCAVPADAPVMAWTTPAGTTRRRDRDVPIHALAVDIGGDLRWLAASMMTDKGDEITEVIL